jgi:hypothetical protein
VNGWDGMIIIRMMKSWGHGMGRTCSTIKKKGNACRLLIGEPERKGQLERPSHR